MTETTISSLIDGFPQVPGKAQPRKVHSTYNPFASVGRGYALYGTRPPGGLVRREGYYSLAISVTMARNNTQLITV